MFASSTELIIVSSSFDLCKPLPFYADQLDFIHHIKILELNEFIKVLKPSSIQANKRSLDPTIIGNHCDQIHDLLLPIMILLRP
jgi:hypothetical protein